MERSFSSVFNSLILIKFLILRSVVLFDHFVVYNGGIDFLDLGYSDWLDVLGLVLDDFCGDWLSLVLNDFGSCWD